MKFFVQRYVSSTTTFTTRVQNKLVVGLATWREQREVGRRTFEAALVVDVFSNKGVQVVKEIVKTALLAEKLVATIHIDDPVARKPQDKPSLFIARPTLRARSRRPSWPFSRAS